MKQEKNTIIELENEIKNLRIKPNIKELQILGSCYYFECSDPNKWENLLLDLKTTVNLSSHSFVSKKANQLLMWKKNDIIDLAVRYIKNSIVIMHSTTPIDLNTIFIKSILRLRN